MSHILKAYNHAAHEKACEVEALKLCPTLKVEINKGRDLRSNRVWRQYRVTDAVVRPNPRWCDTKVAIWSEAYRDLVGREAWSAHFNQFARKRAA